MTIKPLVSTSKTVLLKVLRNVCKQCCCGSREAIAECIDFDCPAYPYRFGRELTMQDHGVVEFLEWLEKNNGR